MRCSRRTTVVITTVVRRLHLMAALMYVNAGRQFGNRQGDRPRSRSQEGDGDDGY